MNNNMQLIFLENVNLSFASIMLPRMFQKFFLKFNLFVLQTAYKVISFNYFFKKSSTNLSMQTVVCISFFMISIQVRVFMWKASV